MKKNEKYIKEMLKKALEGIGTFQLSEFTFYGGSLRPDYVVLEENAFHYYEIKTELDTFSRLHRQYHGSKDLFTHMNLIINKERFPEYLKELNKWIDAMDWNIYFIEDLENGTFLHGNPKIHGVVNANIEVEKVINIMWKDEPIREIKKLKPEVKSIQRLSVDKLSNLLRLEVSNPLELLNSVLPNRNYYYRAKRMVL